MRFAVTGLLLCAACGDEGADTAEGPCVEGPASVKPGVGEFQLQILNGGESIEMIHGPQGGWHVDTAAQVNRTGEVIDIVPSLVLTESGVSIAGIDQQAEIVALGSYDAEICEGNIIARRAYIDDVAHVLPYVDFICTLDGKEVELTMTVTDVVTGDVGSGSAKFILLIDPNDTELCQ